MLMSCTPLPASKVNSDLHAACRQSKEVERVRRELELWRAEAQLLDCAGSHFIGAKRSWQACPPTIVRVMDWSQKLSHRSTKEAVSTVFLRATLFPRRYSDSTMLQ